MGVTLEVIRRPSNSHYKYAIIKYVNEAIHAPSMEL